MVRTEQQAADILVVRRSGEDLLAQYMQILKAALQR